MNNSYVLEYYNAIKAGEIIVGQELMLQLEKLVDIINNPSYHEEENNIIFDIEESEKRIRFIETQCKHFEAPYAGKPFILELFQKAFIEAIFAFKLFDEELQKYVRLHQDILYLVGRKNGKTPLISAICLSEFFCGPTGLKILCASNDDTQAGLMFDAINAMREESRALEKVTRKNLKGIFFGNPKQKKKKGKFSSQNKGNIKKMSAKAGAKEGRNIGIGAVDEVFEMEDDSTVMPIRQALSTQDEPLYFELTTEGFTNGGYLDQRLSDARKVLKGEMKNDRWLIWIYTQDNEQEVWQDEQTWHKSNPGLGTIKKWSFLRRMIEESKTSTSKKAFVLAKDFNLKQNNAQAWLSKQDIENDLEMFDMEFLRNSIVIGGCDLSETGDLTNSRILLYNPSTKMKYTISKYFIPYSKLEEATEEDRNKYKEWAKQGYLYICDDHEVNQSDVVAWFVMLYKKYKIKCLYTGYDKWQSKAFVNEMKDYGFDLERIGQGWDLSNAMNSLEMDLKYNLINYNQNPIDKYCLENVTAKWNSQGTKRMPMKVQGDNTKKIDGAVTMLICYETLDRFRREYTDIVRR